LSFSSGISMEWVINLWQVLFECTLKSRVHLEIVNEI
jgi:hypothetical protein